MPRLPLRSCQKPTLVVFRDSWLAQLKITSGVRFSPWLDSTDQPHSPQLNNHLALSSAQKKRTENVLKEISSSCASAAGYELVPCGSTALWFKACSCLDRKNSQQLHDALSVHAWKYDQTKRAWTADLVLSCKSKTWIPVQQQRVFIAISYFDWETDRDNGSKQLSTRSGHAVLKGWSSFWFTFVCAQTLDSLRKFTLHCFKHKCNKNMTHWRRAFYLQIWYQTALGAGICNIAVHNETQRTPLPPHPTPNKKPVWLRPSNRTWSTVTTTYARLKKPRVLTHEKNKLLALCKALWSL